MKFDKKEIHKILLITLSNLGDIILTTPVLEKLHDTFPWVSIDVITGAPGKDIFRAHTAVGEVTVHKKHQSLSEKIQEVNKLRHKKYDLVVDIKNSLVPYLIGAKYHTGFFDNKFLLKFRSKQMIRHKKEEHLLRLFGFDINPFSNTRFFIPISDNDRSYVDGVMDSGPGGKAVVINPGAKSHLKRWGAEKFAKLADMLVSVTGCRVFITGNEDDKETSEKVNICGVNFITDLTCKTSVGALAELMRRVDLVITNDSAPMHIASAVNATTIAIFGPSDEQKYRPLAEGSRVIKPDISCRPCSKAQCDIGRYEGCISQVTVEEVFQAAKEMLEQ